MRKNAPQLSRALGIKYMTDEEFDPKRVKKAKELASGPLGQEMGKFPLRFAKPVFFGQKPSKGETIKVKNGTITFIKLEERPIGITCSHVVDEYRKISQDGNCVFQIGHLEFDPLVRIIDQSPEMDLVTIDLEGLDVTNSFLAIDQ